MIGLFYLKIYHDQMEDHMCELSEPYGSNMSGKSDSEIIDLELRTTAATDTSPVDSKIRYKSKLKVKWKVPSLAISQ